jgi:hypothetical protein
MWDHNEHEKVQVRVRLGNALIEQMFSASAGSGHADGRAYGVGPATAA